MTAHHQPSGLKHGLALFIDPNWSPAQARAVIEVLDDLRDRICAVVPVVWTVTGEE